MSSSRLLSCIDADVLRLASNFYARILLLWLKLHVDHNRERVKFWSCLTPPQCILGVFFAVGLEIALTSTKNWVRKNATKHLPRVNFVDIARRANKCALNGARNFLHSSDELKSRTSFWKWKIKCHFRVETKRVQFCDSLLDKYWLKCAS